MDRDEALVNDLVNEREECRRRLTRLGSGILGGPKLRQLRDRLSAGEAGEPSAEPVERHREGAPRPRQG